MKENTMYEVYREKFRITEWKDGCVWRTKSLGCGWFPEDEIKANRPGETGVMYVAASDEFARNNMTTRRARARCDLGHEVTPDGKHFSVPELYEHDEDPGPPEHDCPKQAFLDDPITEAYGVGYEMLHLIRCPVCDAEETP